MLLFLYESEGMNMNYRELLNKLIKESGLSNKEIVARCAEFGEKITPNYLSVIKNNDDKIPSDNLSLALAKACNSPHENILLVQGYLDRAPEVIINFLENMKKSALKSTYTFLEKENSMPRELKDELLRSQKAMEESLFLSLFICEADKFQMQNDEKEVIDNYIMPDIKWALIPIVNPNSIRILSKDKVADLI